MDEKVINDYCQVVKHSTMYVDYFKTSTARFIRATVSSLPNTQEMSNMCGPLPSPTSIWFNHQYIQQKPNEEIAELFVPVLKEHGVEAPFEKVVTVVGMMKDRVSFVKELWETCSFFFVAPTEYDEKTVKKRWKEDSAKCMTELAEVDITS